MRAWRGQQGQGYDFALEITMLGGLTKPNRRVKSARNLHSRAASRPSSRRRHLLRLRRGEAARRRRRADPGERRVSEAEAEIVRRIFREFAAGTSPRAIARRVSDEGIPGAKGRLWSDSVLRGRAKRGTGPLNNELYIGRLVWKAPHPPDRRPAARPAPREPRPRAEGGGEAGAAARGGGGAGLRTSPRQAARARQAGRTRRRGAGLRLDSRRPREAQGASGAVREARAQARQASPQEPRARHAAHLLLVPPLRRDAYARGGANERGARYGDRAAASTCRRSGRGNRRSSARGISSIGSAPGRASCCCGTPLPPPG